MNMAITERFSIFVIVCITLTETTGVVPSVQQPTPWRDPSPHKVQFVTVEKDVHLEVLDWGGAGRAVVLLAGSGNTAHVYDEFAPKAHQVLPPVRHHSTRIR